MRKEKQPFVYIMANKKNGTLYIGVTSDPVKRIYEHKTGATKGFTSKYGCTMLVWYEVYDDMVNAIAREKRLKGGSRKQKLELIENMNPDWKDVYETIL
jgi:predicted GIY-YIG superfamily endonuclease